MESTTAFCPNEHCHARGQTGQGNIGIHSQKEQRFICHAWHKTFSARKGTVFYRLRTSAETVVIVVTLLAHGCPVQAQAEMILYAALDPAMASRARRGEFVRCLDH
jgi:transposase-like protein